MTDLSNQRPAKDDIFGVCRRIGEDLGFPANLLRIALALGLIWSIEGVFAVYAGLGVMVLISRIVAPVRRSASVSPVAAIDTARESEPEMEWRRAA